MNLPDVTAAAFRAGLAAPLDELAESFRLSGKQSPAEGSDPALLATAFGQLFDAMQRSEATLARPRSSGRGPAAEAVTELGEYALGLFEQASYWANHLDLPGVSAALQAYTIAVACWIARLGGQLLTLEPIVDAFAARANDTQASGELTALYERIGEALGATAPIIRQDIEKTNPGRPWRILHLNRAIVATRTHQPELMEEAFDSLVEHLPEDAAGFFSQGMEQMELLNYPPHVRAVMDRYYKRWSVNRSLH
jgi:hypothetical protein